jgi:hypothetical protein
MYPKTVDSSLKLTSPNLPKLILKPKPTGHWRWRNMATFAELLASDGDGDGNGNGNGMDENDNIMIGSV